MGLNNKRCKLNLAMPHAFSKSSISSTKTSKSMLTPWLIQSKRENGENSQTNGSRNTTSRTAAHAPLLPTPFPTWSSKTARTVKKWGRIVMFFQCEHEQKYKTCMNHDMKQKLEKSFGKIEDLEQATGLPEYQLLPLTMKLLHEQMDMFNM